MAKKLLLLLIITLAGTGRAQSVLIKGNVKDVTNNRPLSHVTVASDDDRWVTVTNEQGAFALACPADTKKIKFSYLGYATYTSVTSKLPADGTYYLEPKDFQLDEVVIMNTSINEFMDKLIESSKRQLRAPIVLSTYYREFIKINDKNTKFADGLIDYNFYKKKNHIKTKIVVKQNRAVELDTFKEGIVQGVGPSVVDAMAVEGNFAVLSQLLYKKAIYKNYDYVIKPIKSEQGKALSLLSFTPKDGIKEDLYTINVIFDPQKNLILDIDIKAVPHLVQYSRKINLIFARYTTSFTHYKSSFKIVDGNYMPSYAYFEGVVHVWNKNYDNTYRFKNDMIVTGFSTAEADFTKDDNYDERSLYKRGNNYTEEFWLKNNSIILTDEEEQIIQDLNKQKQEITIQSN